MKTRFEFCSEKLTARIDEEMLHINFGEKKPSIKIALTDAIALIHYLKGIISSESVKN